MAYGLSHSTDNGNRTEGVKQTPAAMRLAAKEAGSLISDGVSEGRARYADKIAQHMTFPDATNAEAVERFDALMEPVGECVGLLRQVVERVEGLWLTTQRPGVVTVSTPDRPFEPHDGRGLNSSKARPPKP